MEQSKQKKEKAFPIAIAICIGICLVLVAVVSLIGPMTANSRMNQVERILSGEGEVIVVLRDPTQRGETIFSTAEVVLRNEEANALRDTILGVVRETKFDQTDSIPRGNWNVGALIYVGERKTTVYFTEEQICMEHNSKLTYYDIRDGAKSAYAVLYEEVKTLLDENN